MEYGYFAQERREYVITRPDTPEPVLTLFLEKPYRIYNVIETHLEAALHMNDGLFYTF